MNMNDILITLAAATLSSSILGLLFIAVRKVLNRHTSSSFWYYMWLIVVLRFLVPVGIPFSAFAIHTYTVANTIEDTAPASIAPGRLSDDTAATGESGMAAPTAIHESTAAASPAISSRMIFPASHLPAYFVPAILVIWLSIALCSLAKSIISNNRFLRSVRQYGTPIEDGTIKHTADRAAAQAGLTAAPPIYLLAGISVPMQVGLLHPAVILPAGTATETMTDSANHLHYVFLHEFIHCRRRDILYKWVIQLFVSLHWFNPLVYWFQAEIAKDCELSCDEQVLARLNQNEYRAYGNTLLNILQAGPQRPSLSGSAMLARDSRLIKRRLTQIAEFGRHKKNLAIIAMLTTVLLMICGFNAVPILKSKAPDGTLAPSGEPAPLIPYRSAAQKAMGINDPREIATHFTEYESYGLTHSLQYNRLYYNGQLVRYFRDDQAPNRYIEWPMPDGTVDVFAVRSENGKLTGLSAATREDFDNRSNTIMNMTHAFTYSISLGPDTESEYVYNHDYSYDYEYQTMNETILIRTYEEYEPFGLTYNPDTDRLYYNNQLVKFFSDMPDGGVGTSNNRYFGPFSDGKVTVHAVRDESGALTGLTVTEASERDGEGVDWRNFSH